MNNEEYKIQCALIAWRDNMKHAWPELHMLFSQKLGVKRGGKAGAIQGKMEKDMGAVAGVPDLFLSVPMGRQHGLYLECKKPKGGVVSKEQKDFAGRAALLDYEWRVFRSTEEGIAIITEYLGR